MAPKVFSKEAHPKLLPNRYKTPMQLIPYRAHSDN
jgi:hypothetical protein